MGVDEGMGVMPSRPRRVLAINASQSTNLVPRGAMWTVSMEWSDRTGWSKEQQD